MKWPSRFSRARERLPMQADSWTSSECAMTVWSSLLGLCVLSDVVVIPLSRDRPCCPVGILRRRVFLTLPKK
jgi:hypothetical protein